MPELSVRGAEDMSPMSHPQRIADAVREHVAATEPVR